MKLKPHWQIILSLVLATLIGLYFKRISGASEAASEFAKWVMMSCEVVGKIFLGLLKMIIVPLVVSSVIAGITSLHGVKGFGRLLRKTASFYALTSLLAICLGLLLVNTIQPGLTEFGQPNEQIRSAFENYEVSNSQQEKVEKLSLIHI